MDEISVLLVEDDAMVGGWVKVALARTAFRLVGAARTAEQATDLVQQRHPDVLLVDYRLSRGRGTELVRELRRKGIATPALLMTANPEPGFNELVREAGGQGSVLKTGSAGELLEALRSVSAGTSAFDVRYPARPVGRSPLSPRELEALGLVAGGATNRQVANTLGIGEETVKTILERAFAKLGVHRRAQAVAAAASMGLI
jgi:DNA-binding NarL/FixJ family response regulator